jgi:hypothetical protein
MGGGRYRLVADRPPGDASPDAPPPSLAQCEAIVRARVGASIAPSDLAWSSYFRLHSRMVARLRHGRVFFAGDAAHVHSPAGAQGMNTGMQEAFNLGWKLARVLGGGTPERLLDTYHAERHPIERDVLRQTGLVTQIVEADHGAMKLLRDHVVPLLATFGPVRDAVRRTVSELGVQYRKSPLTLERVLDGGPRAGERAPDALVHVVDGPLGRAPGTARLYDLHDPASFTLLLLEEPAAVDAGDANGVPPMPADARALAQGLERIMPGAVRIWRVADAESDGEDGLAQAYGRSRPSFYLLRPDGYIAARGRTATDANALLRHCESWFAGMSLPA